MAGIFTEQPVYIIPPTQTSPVSLKQVANDIIGKSRDAQDPSSMQLVGSSISSVDSALNTIMQALRKPVPQPSSIAVTDSSGNLIGWIGFAIVAGKSFSGAWFKTLYVGGTDATNAPLVADANGNLTITNAHIVLNGSSAIITLDPTVGFVRVQGVISGVVSDLNSSGIVVSHWNGSSAVLPSAILNNTAINFTDASGNQATLQVAGSVPSLLLQVVGTFPELALSNSKLTYTDTSSQTIVLDVSGTTPTFTVTPSGGLQIKTNIDGASGLTISRSFDSLRTQMIPGSIIEFDNAGGLATTLDINGLHIGAATIVTAAGVVQSTNGFTGSQTYVKTVNFVGSSVTTGTVTTVAGIVTNMT